MKVGENRIRRKEGEARLPPIVQVPGLAPEGVEFRGVQVPIHARLHFGGFGLCGSSRACADG